MYHLAGTAASHVRELRSSRGETAAARAEVERVALKLTAAEQESALLRGEVSRLKAELEAEKNSGVKEALETANKTILKLEEDIRADKVRVEKQADELGDCRKDLLAASAEKEVLTKKVSELRARGIYFRKKMEEANTRIQKRWVEAGSYCASRIEKLKKHILGRVRASRAESLVGQAKGTLDCLRLIERADGLNIPAGRFEQLQDKEAKYRAQLESIDYPDLEADDYVVDFGSCPSLPLPEVAAPLSSPCTSVAS